MLVVGARLSCDRHVADAARTLVLGRVQVWHDLRLSPGRHSVSLTRPLVAPLL